MRKKLFGTLVFSLILSSLAYAEADAEKMRERREAFEKSKMQSVEEQVVTENSNSVVSQTTLSPEDEKEAYAALERVRARIEKEEKERLKAQQEAEEQVQREMEVQTEVVEEQIPMENSNSNEPLTENVISEPRMSPEEEKEAYVALERVRARIKKEDEERARALQMVEEQAQ